jgi:hypothetical protein
MYVRAEKRERQRRERERERETERERTAMTLASICGRLSLLSQN